MAESWEFVGVEYNLHEKKSGSIAEYLATKSLTQKTALRPIS